MGARSIIGDQEIKNAKYYESKIKYRESFRPFAPSVLEEDVSSQFELSNKSPYMLVVAQVKELQKEMSDKEKNYLELKN